MDAVIYCTLSVWAVIVPLNRALDADIFAVLDILPVTDNVLLL